MPQRKSSRVLRAAIVVEDKLCGELHQTEPGGLKVGWGLHNDLVVHDSVDRRRDPRKIAKPLLAMAMLMLLSGFGLFVTDVNRYAAEQAARQEALEGQDANSFDVYDYGSETEGPDLALIGLTLLLMGLAPLVGGIAGLRSPELDPPKGRRKKPKRVAPESVTLFEYRGGRYYLNLPKEARGKVTLAKGKRAYTVKQLRRKQGSARVQVALRSTAKGKILLGDSIVLFQFARPKRKSPTLRPLRGYGLSGTPLPLAYGMLLGMVGSIGVIGFLLGPIGLVGCLAVGAGVNLVLQRQRDPLFAAILLGSVLIFGTGGMYTAFGVKPSTVVKIDQRFVEVMGVVYEQEEEPELEEEEEPEPEEEELKQPEEKQEKKQVEPDKVVKTKPKKFSEEATKKARGVGVARVLGTYGGPGEGTVFDVIESTENNLDSLFDKGMGRVVDADGTEVSDFVAGGEGITASGALVGTEGLKTTDDQPEVAKKKKREKKIKGKVKSSTSEVYGDVDKKLVQATIRRRMGALQSCYEKSLRSQSALKGKITFTIMISTSGRVVKVSVEGDTLGDSTTLSCCKAKIKGWRFPVEGAEDSSEVTFSVVFSQA